MLDNVKLMGKASVNLGARGQVYHHDYASMIEKDPEITVIKKIRKQNGMLYYYELRKNHPEKPEEKLEDEPIMKDLPT